MWREREGGEGGRGVKGGGAAGVIARGGGRKEEVMAVAGMRCQGGSGAYRLEGLLGWVLWWLW